MPVTMCGCEPVPPRQIRRPKVPSAASGAAVRVCDRATHGRSRARPGLSEVELRRRNFVQDGGTLATGQVVRENVDMRELLSRAMELGLCREASALFRGQSRGDVAILAATRHRLSVVHARGGLYWIGRGVTWHRWSPSTAMPRGGCRSALRALRSARARTPSSRRLPPRRWGSGGVDRCRPPRYRGRAEQRPDGGFAYGDDRRGLGRRCLSCPTRPAARRRWAARFVYCSRVCDGGRDVHRTARGTESECAVSAVSRCAVG